MRGWGWIGACGSLAVLGGCTVGHGVGIAMGTLFVDSCNYGVPLAVNPQTGASESTSYNLNPGYFAGTPFDDQFKGPQQMNALQIRLATTGLEFSDVFGFQIQSSLEVARCVRGRTVNGQPDYLVTMPLPAALGTAANPNPTTLWCDWSGMAFSDGGVPDAAMPGPPDASTALDGGMSTTATAPRIYITPYTYVIAGLRLSSTCQASNAAATGMSGWIQFVNFGTAEESNLPPDQRDPVSPDFIINYGDRLRAYFDVNLGDPRYVNAIMTGTAPPPSPAIGGEIAGYFDFDLARGRSAQPFP